MLVPALLRLQRLLTQDLAETMNVGPENRQRNGAVETRRTETKYPVQSVVAKGG